MSRLWGTAALALVCCAAPYQAPCEISDRLPNVATGFTPELAASGDGTVVAIGWALVDDDDASTRLAEVAVLSPDGAVVERVSIPIPVPLTEVLEVPSGIQLAWTGAGVAVLRRITEVLPADGAGEHFRSVLTFRAIPIDGVAGEAVELTPTACVDCQLSWGARALNGRVAVVYKPRPLTVDIDDPIGLSRTQYLVASADRDITATGVFLWPATPDALGSFEVDSDGTGFTLGSPEGVRRLDPDLRPLGDPIRTESPGSVVLDVGVGGVFALWTDESTHVLLQGFRGNAVPEGRAQRVSRGFAAAVHGGRDAVGTVFWDGADAYFAAIAGDKIGGDVPIPTTRGVLFAPGALFVDHPTGFAMFIGSEERVDRVEIRCAF